ncbi:hypothetical protein EC2726950_2320 [Escherichia coli 2726950]|nr:hypothetical protein EC2726950_2320 [Escherichia coli 2726950]
MVVWGSGTPMREFLHVMIWRGSIHVMEWRTKSGGNTRRCVAH